MTETFHIVPASPRALWIILGVLGIVLLLLFVVPIATVQGSRSSRFELSARHGWHEHEEDGHQHDHEVEADPEHPGDCAIHLVSEFGRSPIAQASFQPRPLAADTG